MIFSFLFLKMQTPQKGDALSPRPVNCILRTRSNEENAAHAGLAVAAGLGARPNVANRCGSPRAGPEQVGRSLRGRTESRGKPHRGGPRRCLAKGQLLRIVGSWRQSGLCLLVLADAAPIRGTELPGWAAEPARFHRQQIGRA